MSTYKNVIQSDDDYGFTFDENIQAVEEQAQTIEEYQNRIDALVSVMFQFLDALAKNPEKETIKWPDRAARIQEIKKKITDISKG